ncbi:unnamed protein product [Ectocarpus sp. 12 AP-2014]
MDVVRGKAVEAIALMGQAVGLEVFREDAHQVIRLLLNEQKQTVARDPANPQSTYTFQALARMAGVLGEEFLPFLSEAVTPLLAALSTAAEMKLSDAPDAEGATLEFEDAGLTAMTMDLRGAGPQVFGVNKSLMQAKESACKALYQYTEDLGDGFAPHAAATLSVVLRNLGPKNPVGVQVVSAAIVPRLVGLAARRAEAATAVGGGGGGGGGGGPVEWVREAQVMLDASIDALTEMVSRLGGESGESGGGCGGGLGGGSAQQEELFEKGDQEPACVVADSLSNLLEGRCSDGGDGAAGVLRVSDERLLSTVTVLRNVAAASIRRTRSLLAATAAAAAVSARGLGGVTGAEEAAELAELEEGEEEMLISVADATGWMIRGRKAAFLPTFEAVPRPLVLPLLDSTAATAAALPSSHRSFGLSIAIDVLEHAGEGGRRAVFPEPLLPALLEGCREDELAASARQVVVMTFWSLALRHVRVRAGRGSGLRRPRVRPSQRGGPTAPPRPRRPGPRGQHRPPSARRRRRRRRRQRRGRRRRGGRPVGERRADRQRHLRGLPGAVRPLGPRGRRLRRRPHVRVRGLSPGRAANRRGCGGGTRLPPEDRGPRSQPPRAVFRRRRWGG